MLLCGMVCQAIAHQWESYVTIYSSLLRAGDCITAAAGLFSGPLDGATLIARARRHTGLSAFGDLEFVEPMNRLLESISAESSLSLFGRLATEWDVVRFLSNLLRMVATEQANPTILERPIERPIFIMGLPRSGTTFLHRLMMTDPDTKAPLVWETIFPFPDTPAGPDKRAARVAKQLRTFGRIAPEFAGLHPLAATSPQECSEILAHVFRSLRFDTNYLIPSYRAWLDADAELHRPAYRFHKRFLRHLDVTRPAGGRWVLKCPEHLFAISALRTVYPDARIIFVHRDPVKVLLSVTRLTEVLREPFTRELDPIRIGREESARWLSGTWRMIEAGDDAGFPEPICHVHHLDLVTDPRATLDMVYRYFGLTMTEAMGEAIETYVRARPKGGYGKHEYRFEDHGLNEAEERAKFRPYMVRFGIAPESAPSSTGRNRRSAERLTAG